MQFAPRRQVTSSRFGTQRFQSMAKLRLWQLSSESKAVRSGQIEIRSLAVAGLDGPLGFGRKAGPRNAALRKKFRRRNELAKSYDAASIAACSKACDCVAGLHSCQRAPATGCPSRCVSSLPDCCHSSPLPSVAVSPAPAETRIAENRRVLSSQKIRR